MPENSHKGEDVRFIHFMMNKLCMACPGEGGFTQILVKYGGKCDYVCRLWGNKSVSCLFNKLKGWMLDPI